jgi:hypothetical protein
MKDREYPYAWKAISGPPYLTSAGQLSRAFPLARLRVNRDTEQACAVGRDKASSGNRFGSKAPKDKHRGGDYCDADSKEPNRHKALLP